MTENEKNEKLVKVTIVIPVYNVSQYIRRCVLSLQKQTYRGAVECLFIDDCSPDDSCRQITSAWKNYSGNIEWKIIHHKNNKGLSGARNTGIDNANGDYVYFFDSDDEITSDCIESLTAPLLSYHYEMIIGGYIPIKAKRAYPSLSLPTGEIKGNSTIIDKYFHGNYYMMAWNKLCRLDFIKRNRLYFKEGLIHEDDLWSYCVACEATYIYIVNHPTYLYHIRENSIATEKDVQKHLDAFIEVTKQMFLWNLHSKENERTKWRYVFFRMHYTLLWKSIEEKVNYNKCYKAVRDIMKESPIFYWRKGWLSTKELFRDCHWLFPICLGKYIHLLDYKLFKR